MTRTKNVPGLAGKLGLGPAKLMFPVILGPRLGRFYKFFTKLILGSQSEC